MLPTITKGYLISKFDYDVFDEILIFLTNEGNILSCYSEGSRKINSKNGRNTFFGNFLEIEYFNKQNKKLKKLKKITTLHHINSIVSDSETLKLINILFSKFEAFVKEDIKFYQLYQEALSLILLEKDKIPIFNYVFFKFFNKINKVLDLNFCEKCYRPIPLRTLSLKHIGWECFNCYEEDSIIFSDLELQLINKILHSHFFEPEGSEIVISKDIYLKLMKNIIEYKKEYNKE